MTRREGKGREGKGREDEVKRIEEEMTKNAEASGKSAFYMLKNSKHTTFSSKKGANCETSLSVFCIFCQKAIISGLIKKYPGVRIFAQRLVLVTCNCSSRHSTRHSSRSSRVVKVETKSSCHPTKSQPQPQTQPTTPASSAQPACSLCSCAPGLDNSQSFYSIDPSRGQTAMARLTPRPSRGPLPDMFLL